MRNAESSIDNNQEKFTRVRGSDSGSVKSLASDRTNYFNQPIVRRRVPTNCNAFTSINIYTVESDRIRTETLSTDIPLEADTDTPIIKKGRYLADTDSFSILINRISYTFYVAWQMISHFDLFKTL